MLNIRVVTWSLGIFTAASFVLCVIYGLIAPPSLHMAPFLSNIRLEIERRDRGRARDLPQPEARTGVRALRKLAEVHPVSHNATPELNPPIPAALGLDPSLTLNGG